MKYKNAPIYFHLDNYMNSNWSLRIWLQVSCWHASKVLRRKREWVSVESMIKRVRGGRCWKYVLEPDIKEVCWTGEARVASDCVIDRQVNDRRVCQCPLTRPATAAGEMTCVWGMDTSTCQIRDSTCTCNKLLWFLTYQLAWANCYLESLTVTRIDRLKIKG